MENLERWALTFLLNALWQPLVVVAAAALATRLLRRAPARYPHRLWVVALVLAVLLPAAAWRSPALAPGDAPSGIGLRPVQSAAPLAAQQPPGRVTLGFSRVAARAVVMTWLGIMLLRTLGLLRSWRATQALRRAAQARDVPPEARRILERCAAELGIEAAPVLCSPAGPLTLGLRRPVILLPECLYDAPDELFSTALAHEMAHIRRHDFGLNLLYHALALPLAWHPAVWLLKRRIDQTRELACDEVVAGRLLDREAYARSVVRIAGAAAGVRPPAYALGVADANVLKLRIARLLEGGPRLVCGPARRRMVAGSVLLAGACIAASLAPIGPSETISREAVVGTWRGEGVILVITERNGRIESTLSWRPYQRPQLPLGAPPPPPPPGLADRAAVAHPVFEGGVLRSAGYELRLKDSNTGELTLAGKGAAERRRIRIPVTKK